MSRTDRINVGQLMQDTDGGRLIWERELGKIPNKKIPSPLRDDGKTPAFSIFYKDGLYLFKDFGGKGEGGDIIKFIMLRYNLTYRKALENIRDGISINPVEITKSYKNKEKQSSVISCVANHNSQSCLIINVFSCVILSFSLKFSELKIL